MKDVLVITDVCVDETAGNAVHVKELFQNLQEFLHPYLVAPYEGTDVDHDSVLTFRRNPIPVPGVVLQKLLFEIVLTVHVLYYTVRLSPGAFYFRYSTWTFAPPLVAKLFGIPLVVEVNGIQADEAESGGERPLLTRILLANEKLSFRLADRFVVVTPQIGDYVNRTYGVPSERIHCIPNGANTDLFEPRPKDECKREAGLDEETSYVCFVGNLAPWQGVEYLLRSAPSVLSENPDAKVLIVGDGVQMDELVSLARELGIADDVIFTGSVPYETVPTYVNASDLCVVYKTPLESGYSPLKLYEYMACERPVVASDVDGFEVLRELDAGVLVEPENPQALARSLTALFGDEERQRAMGRRGREFVVENRSWNAVAENVAEVIERELGSRRTRERRPVAP